MDYIIPTPRFSSLSAPVLLPAILLSIAISITITKDPLPTPFKRSPRNINTKHESNVPKVGYERLG